MLRHFNLLRAYIARTTKSLNSHHIYLSKIVSQSKAVSESIKLTTDFLIEPYK